MYRDNVETVRSIHRMWSTGDTDAAFALVHPDAIYSLNVAESSLPFAGEKLGRAAFRSAMIEARQKFEYVLFRPTNYVADGDRVTNQVEFMYRHRASGEILSGRYRSVFTLRDGLVTRLDEYCDAPLVQAFMRLFGTGNRGST